MSLGYADPVNYYIDVNRLLLIHLNNRNIFIYGVDYNFLRNETCKLLSLKKPDKYRKRENGMTVNKIII